MTRTVLVTSASKHGSTTDIGDVIASVLARRGLGVIDKSIAEVAGLDGVDAAVIGSAVYVGKWMPEAVTFVERHAAELAQIPVWLFSSGPLGEQPKPTAEPVTIGQLEALLGARPHRVFAGSLDSGKLGLGERLIVNMVRAPSGDYRDFGAIEQWATTIADVLLANDDDLRGTAVKPDWDEADATREAVLAGAGY